MRAKRREEKDCDTNVGVANSQSTHSNDGTMVLWKAKILLDKTSSLVLMTFNKTNFFRLEMCVYVCVGDVCRCVGHATMKLLLCTLFRIFSNFA